MVAWPARLCTRTGPRSPSSLGRTPPCPALVGSGQPPDAVSLVCGKSVLGIQGGIGVHWHSSEHRLRRPGNTIFLKEKRALLADLEFRRAMPGHIQRPGKAHAY